MKRRPSFELTDEHYLILALLLVILLAISLLYCLGFASLSLRHALDSTPSPGTSIATPAVDSTPTWPPAVPTAQPLPSS